MDIVTSAKGFAVTLYRNQKMADKKTPFLDHLENVVNRLKPIGVSDEVLAAAWLHDAIDDSLVGFDDLFSKFGREVAVLVSSISVDRSIPKKDQDTKYIQQLRQAPLEAKIIKLFHIASAIRELSALEISKNQRNKQKKKNLHYFRAIRGDLLDQARYPKISEIISMMEKIR